MMKDSNKYKPTILFVNTHFPPEQHISCYRNLAFANYLDKEKYDLHFFVSGEDDDNKEELPGVTIHRVANKGILKSIDFKRRKVVYLHKVFVLINLLLRFLLVYHNGYWIRRVVKKIIQLNNERRIDLIITQYGPIAPHKVGLRIKKIFPKVKWIADNRDHISEDPVLPYIVKESLKRVEKKVLNNADAITAVSKPILDSFRLNCSIKNQLFVEIRNGYDFECDSSEKIKKDDLFVIRYIGSFYGGRKPNNFFKALSDFAKKIGTDNFLFEYAGKNSHIYIPDDLRNSVKYLGFVDHKRAIELMCSSDVLLLLHPAVPGIKGVYTGKLFEYLATRKPVLALVDTDDVAANLINDANAGYVCENEDITGIVKNLNKLYKNWMAGVKLEYNEKLINEHHRKKQVKRMEKVIDQLLGEVINEELV